MAEAALPFHSPSFSYETIPGAAHLQLQSRLFRSSSKEKPACTRAASHFTSSKKEIPYCKSPTAPKPTIPKFSIHPIVVSWYHVRRAC